MKRTGVPSMINTTKKKKRRKKPNQTNQREIQKNKEQKNRSTGPVRATYSANGTKQARATKSAITKKPTRINIQTVDTTPSASRTVHDDSSSSSCSSVDFKETLRNGEEDSFENMVNSGSEMLNLARQTKLYKSSKQEEICTDTVMCIQRYLKNIFRQVRLYLHEINE